MSSLEAAPVENSVVRSLSGTTASRIAAGLILSTFPVAAGSVRRAPNQRGATNLDNRMFRSMVENLTVRDVTAAAAAN
jgi:hypothetical protein